jgi:CRP/FNR family transcriptional regulator, cyclic AMP receptor protein
VVRILDVEPDLGRALSGDSLEAARRDVVGVVDRLAVGRWPHSSFERYGGSVMGLLVLEGLLAREVHLANTTCTELLGRGDLLRPWDEDGEYAPVPSEVEWEVLEQVRLVVLDERFVRTTARWPELLGALTGRALGRARWLSLQLAIRCLTRVDVRVLVLFWHLADRWGHVEQDGVAVPMRLTHETIGRLIAVRRASVTTSLKRLRERGFVLRRPDRTWLLHSEGLEAIPRLYHSASRADVVSRPADENV